MKIVIDDDNEGLANILYDLDKNIEEQCKDEVSRLTDLIWGPELMFYDIPYLNTISYWPDINGVVKDNIGHMLDKIWRY